MTDFADKDNDDGNDDNVDDVNNNVEAVLPTDDDNSLLSIFSDVNDVSKNECEQENNTKPWHTHLNGYPLHSQPVFSSVVLEERVHTLVQQNSGESNGTLDLPKLIRHRCRNNTNRIIANLLENKKKVTG